MDTSFGQTELRILLLEDVPTDAELVEDALREAGLSFIAKRVDTKETFIRALEEFKPDIVLADYNLPAFDGGSAVKIAQQQYPTVPVVMVTGAVGDETAVELLRLGAKDYILKDRLARLGPAVQRALSEEKDARARKVAEEALLQSEADLRTLVEHSPVAMIVDIGVDADEKIMMMNQKFTGLFGYTMEDVPDVRHWWPLAYPDEKYRKELRAEWTRRVEQAIQSHGEIEPMEVTVACKDGSNRYVRVSLASIGSRNIITFEDLTERKRAETMLHESEEKFRAIFDSALDGIVLSDVETKRFAIGNPAICRMLGYSPEEITRIGVSDIHPQQDLPHIIEQFEKLSRGEIQLVEDIPVKRKDGSVFYADIKGSIVNFCGKIYLAGIFRDITERKQAKEKFQRFFDLIPDLGCIASPDGRLLEINPMWQKTLGYTKQEILSKPFFDFIHPDDIAATMKEVARQLAGKATKQFINRYRCKDGSYRWLEWESTPAVDRKLLFAVAHDITERKQAESLLAGQLNELRQWHDATLGREMRILDLKHEVNELLGKSGQPPRYPSAESDDRTHPDA